jgi:hypothetical protein
MRTQLGTVGTEGEGRASPYEASPPPPQEIQAAAHNLQQGRFFQGLGGDTMPSPSGAGPGRKAQDLSIPLPKAGQPSLKFYLKGSQGSPQARLYRDYLLAPLPPSPSHFPAPRSLKGGTKA